MKISHLGTVLVGIVGLLSFRDVSVSANLTSHPSRPGSTRKSPKKIMENHRTNGKGLVYAYFGTWTSYTKSINTDGKMVDVLYMSFASFKTTYDGNMGALADAHSLKNITGLEYASAQAIMDEMKLLRSNNPDIIIMLSLGGETYHPATHAEGLSKIPNVIKIIDDFGFDGVDMDYEPHGNFDGLNREDENTFFIEYTRKVRELMCDDKLISISVSSNGALPCSHMPGNKLCVDDSNPYGPAYMSGQSGTPNPDVVSAAGMASSGTSIAIINNLKEIIDIIFVQTYNLTNARDPLVMIDLYKSFLYYGEKYNMSIAMGFTVMRSDNPFRAGDKNFVTKVAEAIKSVNKSSKRSDGLGVWGYANGEQYIGEQDYMKMWKTVL